jgi:hypothetical protein
LVLETVWWSYKIEKLIFNFKIKTTSWVHAYNPSTEEAEAGGSLVQGQPELRREISISKKKKKR